MVSIVLCLINNTAAVANMLLGASAAISAVGFQHKQANPGDKF